MEDDLFKQFALQKKLHTVAQSFASLHGFRSMYVCLCFSEEIIVAKKLSNPSFVAAVVPRL